MDFPASQHTVRVRLIDTTSVLTIKAESFVKPASKGLDLLNVTNAAFLIEHEASNRKIMFDLGVRKDYWNLPPIIQKRLGIIIPSLRVDTDIPTILQDNGISLGSISSVVFSHYHWDHVGDMSLFPSSTEIVVGPGFKASPIVLPGYPEKPDSPLNSSDFAGRHLNEIDFEKAGLRIGGFGAYDFFGDGSFYLLDTPGHCLGHMCGLARTTGGGEDSSFVLMGGDICHFVGDIRPTKAFPLPDPIPVGVLDGGFPSPCPCSVFTDHHPQGLEGAGQDARRTTPFFLVSDHKASAYVEPQTAQTSVDKLVHFEQSANVLVCLAHDPALLKYIPTLNSDPSADMNDWRERGWKEGCRWEWLNELPRDGKPGRPALVEGFWRDGKQWDRPQPT
ncbi:hypothetical protein PV08_04432 [Exophiala spinifera]|uniref:Metallo-beta-lactamase domain-containing protein n=1 Tax=Exophiala spinifera TaxID=91928 RepID=A0A0D1YPU0_9EURO|nr:uncharacterized protein PV08_04432 [Exophiala spinifera]KIW17241.1 hypothetical protein PV08_04432 [Exophiala spinifera]